MRIQDSNWPLKSREETLRNFIDLHRLGWRKIRERKEEVSDDEIAESAGTDKTKELDLSESLGIKQNKVSRWKTISPIYASLVERIGLQGLWPKKEDKKSDTGVQQIQVEDLISQPWHLASGNFIGTTYISNANPDPLFNIKALNSTTLINTNNIDLTNISNPKAETLPSNNQGLINISVLISPSETRKENEISNVTGEDAIFHDPKGIFYKPKCEITNRCTEWLTELEEVNNEPQVEKLN